VGGHARRARHRLRRPEHLVERGGHEAAVHAAGRALVGLPEGAGGDDGVVLDAQGQRRGERVGPALDRAEVERGEGLARVGRPA
jgi:hypothetical protein